MIFGDSLQDRVHFISDFQMGGAGTAFEVRTAIGILYRESRFLHVARQTPYCN